MRPGWGRRQSGSGHDCSGDEAEPAAPSWSWGSDHGNCKGKPLGALLFRESTDMQREFLQGHDVGWRRSGYDFGEGLGPAAWGSPLTAGGGSVGSRPRQQTVKPTSPVGKSVRQWANREV